MAASLKGLLNWRFFRRYRKFGPFFMKTCTNGNDTRKAWICNGCLYQRRHFGQPASKTHPHLIGKGEVTPGISMAEYQYRRHTFMRKLIEKSGTNIQYHIVILPSASKLYMTYDIPYHFRQNTEFLYLSGFQEPDSILVMHTTKSGYKSVLFVPKRDPDRELWDGPRSGDTGAMELTGVTEAYTVDDLENYLYDYCKTYQDYLVWYNMSKPVHAHFHRTVIDEFLKQEGLKSIQSPYSVVQQMRLIKSPSEIGLMRMTTEIASAAFIDVMQFSSPDINEAHLHAKMDYECRIRGAEILAYPPVVAGGDRANTLHYINNDRLVAEGELVLMDAGCEYHGYTSDITRTWPVSGWFTAPQRQLYLALLEIQVSLIELCTSEHSLNDLYREMMSQLSKAVVELDLLPEVIAGDETKLKQVVAQLCPHDVGHYLGMDVHDTSLISKSNKLQPGMVITIEPGLYIKADNLLVPEEYRGIGIRIEDNILITDTKPVVLTSNCPKHPDDIERIMADKIN